MKSVWIFLFFVVISAQSDGQPLQYRMIRRICPSGSYHDPIKDRCRSVPGGGDMLRYNLDARCSGGFQGLLAHSKKSRYYFVCQRYAVLTCSCKGNERFDRFHLECTKSRKKLSKQERKSSAVVDNIIKKYKCIDQSGDCEICAPPTTTVPVEETTFDYYWAFRKAIADFNMAWLASGSIEDTTFTSPKISWSTEAKMTPQQVTRAPTTTTALLETTTVMPLTFLPTTAFPTTTDLLILFNAKPDGPFTFNTRPTEEPTPPTTTGLDYEDPNDKKSAVADVSGTIPVQPTENKIKVAVNPPTSPDFVDEETPDQSNGKPAVELKTILDKVLDKLSQRQNTTIEDLKQNNPEKVKGVKDKLNTFFNGTKDVENEDFVDYVEQNNTQQAYMEAYYVYEFYDENEPDKVLWSEDANQTSIIPLETTTFKSNRTKITSLDGQPVRSDQKADNISSKSLEDGSSPEESLFQETTMTVVVTTSVAAKTTEIDTTTENRESTQTTTNAASDENSKESTAETVSFRFPTPENLVTLPSTTLETTSLIVTTTETMPFTSTLAFTDAETVESTTFDTSASIESKAVRFERESGEFSTLETTVSGSTTEAGTTMFTTTGYPTTLEAFKADEALSTTTLPEEQSTTTMSDFSTITTTLEGESTTFRDETLNFGVESTTFADETSTFVEETSTVTSFNDLFSESTTQTNSEEKTESTTEFTTLVAEISTQETTTAEGYEINRKMKLFGVTTDHTTTDGSTTDFETFSSTDVTTLETTLETTTSLPETSSEPSAETSTFRNDEFGLTTTEVMKTDAPESTTAEVAQTDASESTTADTTSETSAVSNTTTELLEKFYETTISHDESSTGMPDVTSTTEDFDAPTTSTLMPDTPYTDISIENTDRNAVFHLNDTRETFEPTTNKIESTTASLTVSDEASKNDPLGKLEQQPKAAAVEYFYVHDEYPALGDPNANMPEANNSSFMPKRDNSFEYYVESMSASREINPRN